MRRTNLNERIGGRTHSCWGGRSGENACSAAVQGLPLKLSATMAAPGRAEILLFIPPCLPCLVLSLTPCCRCFPCSLLAACCRKRQYAIRLLCSRPRCQ